MPCCDWVLSVAASSSSSTPSWLRRLHAKGGLSIPSHLGIDDLLYGQSPPPPPPPSSPPPPPPPPPLDILPPPPSASAAHRDTNPPTNPKPGTGKPPRYPSCPNPSGRNKRNPLQRQQQAQAQPQPQPQSQPQPPQQQQPQPQPQPPLSSVISDLFAVPSAPRSSRPLKPFRKQHRPLPRPDDKSPPPNKDTKDKAKPKAKKRRRADRAADAERVQHSRTDVTVIDSSTDGWKAAKVLIRSGTVWNIHDREDSGISEPDDLNKGKRRAGLVAKILRDKRKGKDAVLLGDKRASNGDVKKESDDAI